MQLDLQATHWEFKLVIANVGQDNDARVRPVSVQLSCKVRPALMPHV